MVRMWACMLVVLCFVESNHADVDEAKYHEGKLQYEMVVKRTKMPKYGKCWLNTLSIIENGCKELSDVIQSKLALSYLNCFLQLQGRVSYECDEKDTIEHCTRNMAGSDRSSFATFFTHTQNICYFLESQMWQKHTEETINKLSDSSTVVAEQLTESSHLQRNIIDKQNIALINQETIIAKSINLSGIISSSSGNIKNMFDEFKSTTQEQRLMISDVFDRVSHLQSMVLGEISGFYSVIYYTLSILICYLLTSTQRTMSARFWMFGIMTVNFISERTIITWISAEDLLGPNAMDSEEEVYAMQWISRKTAFSLALLCLVVCAYKYQDLNQVNNQLLLDIKRQNSDLRKLFLGNGQDIPVGEFPKLLDSNPSDSEANPVPPAAVVASADTTGYENDSAVGSYCSDTTSFMTESMDNTYILQSVDSFSESGSYTTLLTSQSHQTSTKSLIQELINLKDSVPVQDVQNRVFDWLRGSSSKNRHSDDGPGCSSWSNRDNQEDSRSDNASPGRYNFRTRKTNRDNPAVSTESPRSFSKAVRNLEKVATKNSKIMREKLRKL